MEQVVSNREWGEMSGRVWNIWCGIVYMGEMRGRVWNRWCGIVNGVGFEVVYVTGGVKSCMGLRGRVWNRWCRIVYMG